MITRHQFLAMLHDLLKPKIYLEVGVQYGLSLNLAVHSQVAIGVDPNPLVQPQGNQMIFQSTSDDYFATFNEAGVQHHPIDLAFIDGSHLFEDALKDFNNIAKLCGPRSVIVFDDVLPYNQDIAKRAMPPAGDWTGDVWKVVPVLKGKLAFTGVEMALVDTFPTGTFVAWNLPADDGLRLVGHDPDWEGMETVPDYIINRSTALQPQDVLDRIKEDLCLESQ